MSRDVVYTVEEVEVGVWGIIDENEGLKYSMSKGIRFMDD